MAGERNHGSLIGRRHATGRARHQGGQATVTAARPGAGRITRRSVTIAVTRSAGVTSNAGFSARDTRRRRAGPAEVAAPRPSSRSSISMSSPRGRRQVERRLRRGDDERDPGPRRREGQRVRADLVRHVTVGGDPVGADDARRRRARGRSRDGPAPSTTMRCSMPSSTSSKAVRREPCSSGRVSSAVTDTSAPRSCSARTMPRAVPHSTHASPPALQWVWRRPARTPSSSSRSAPRRGQAPVRRARPPRTIATASATTAAVPSSRRARTRRTAHDRLTAVGRAAAIRTASPARARHPGRPVRPAAPRAPRRTRRPRRSPEHRAPRGGGWRRSSCRRRAPRAMTTSAGGASGRSGRRGRHATRSCASPRIVGSRAVTDPFALAAEAAAELASPHRRRAPRRRRRARLRLGGAASTSAGGRHRRRRSPTSPASRRRRRSATAARRALGRRRRPPGARVPRPRPPLRGPRPQRRRPRRAHRRRRPAAAPSSSRTGPARCAREWPIGQPVLISDHINLTGRSPLTGLDPAAPFGPRFVDLTDLYSAAAAGARPRRRPRPARGRVRRASTARTSRRRPRSAWRRRSAATSSACRR